MALSVQRIRSAARVARADPLRWWRPTAPQQGFLSELPIRAQLRGPNQAGKTECLAALLTDFVTRGGRWTGSWLAKWPGQPLIVWVVCASWKQARVVMRKVHDLFPRDRYVKGTTFTKRLGFSGQAFETVDGALVRFVTSGQEGSSLASETAHAVLIDEPPGEDEWGELCARVKHSGGPVWLFYSPINRPVEWLKKKVDDGEILDFHFELNVPNLWPIDALVPFQTQGQIDQFIADTPVSQRAQRIKAAWDGTTEDRLCTAYDEDQHVDRVGAHDPMQEGGAAWTIAVGMDYGTAKGKMAAALVWAKHADGPDPEIYFADEVYADERQVWEQADLARAIREMLERNGLKYENVDLWIGDRSVEARRAAKLVDVRSMYYAIAAVYGGKMTRFKRIDKPKKGAGSVDTQMAKLNGRFYKNKARLAARCQRLSRFFAHFKGDPHDPLKDIGDAARYAALGLLGVRAYRYHEVSSQ